MPIDPAIEDRDALYYPHIHIRNDGWLRNALLFFPHILRMTPEEYDLNDTDFVRELSKTKGRRDEPLVGCYPLNSSEDYQAGKRLADRLRADVSMSSFKAAYGRASAAAQYKSDSTFQIRKDKFAMPLLEVLEGAGLVWEPTERRRDPQMWRAIHPVIGEIVMSTAAAAAAEKRGLDVVTDLESSHVVTATRDAGLIYDTLLGRAAPLKKHTTGPEIGELMLATTFDLAELHSRDYVKLAEDDDALFDLRSLLASEARRIPAMSDEDQRRKHAAEVADKIVARWEEKRKHGGQFFKKLFRLDAAETSKELATNLLTLALPGTAVAGSAVALGAGAATIALAAAPGLAVGLVLYGLKTWTALGEARATEPTRFLSRVVSHGGVLAAAST